MPALPYSFFLQRSMLARHGRFDCLVERDEPPPGCRGTLVSSVPLPGPIPFLKAEAASGPRPGLAGSSAGCPLFLPSRRVGPQNGC